MWAFVRSPPGLSAGPTAACTKKPLSLSQQGLNRPQGPGREARNGRVEMQAQQPRGRLGRIGTMPLTRSVAPEPSVAVSVLPVNRT